MADEDAVVYLIQEPPAMVRNGVRLQKDLSSAQRYGVIKPILGHRDQASLTPGQCLFTLSKALRWFNPERDYICHAGGDPMAIGLALVALSINGFKEVTNLRWERERDTEGKRKPGGFYVPVKIPLHL